MCYASRSIVRGLSTSQANDEPFRIRTASEAEARALLGVIQSSLSHPEGKGRRAGYLAAAQREELLVLERHDPRAHDWKACAFVEWHMRIDDVLTIRDLGTETSPPHAGMVKQLVLELLRSLNPVEALLKVRRDAADWTEILESIAGFEIEGDEYRRPYWINIWKWTRQAAGRPTRGGPRPNPVRGGR